VVSGQGSGKKSELLGFWKSFWNLMSLQFVVALRICSHSLSLLSSEKDKVYVYVASKSLFFCVRFCLMDLNPP